MLVGFHVGWIVARIVDSQGVVDVAIQRAVSKVNLVHDLWYQVRRPTDDERLQYHSFTSQHSCPTSAVTMHG